MLRDAILVVGGSGFVGRSLVNRLVAAGHRVLVPTRRRDAARHLILLPTVEVMEVAPGDKDALVRLVARAEAVVNLAGIIAESGTQTFDRVHVGITRDLIAAAQACGVRRFLHMSALNADPEGPSRYLRSKGEAESLVAGSGLDWTIFQPSVIFGPGDGFLNLFAGLLRLLPVVPLACPDARFAPVYVGDVAQCMVNALEEDATVGARYPLCGPKDYTLRELVRYVGELTGHRRPVVPLSRALAVLQAAVLERLPGKVMTRDNLASMSRDSVCGGPFPPVFGVTPTPLEAIAPGYLAPSARRSRYDDFRSQSGR